jgi:hypothetical protein
MVPDQVSVGSDPSGGCRVRLGPAALDEERSSRILLVEDIEDVLGVTGGTPRPVRMFRIER